MAKLKESFVFTGMQRDLSVSKHPTQFLYDAKNIRITARDGDTMLSITNERGPKRINKKDSEEYLTITGEYIAHCLLNQYLVVLVYGESSTGSTSMVNKMFRIDLKNLTSRTLFEYDFGTTPEDHVDMIASYENEGVQKIYWTDGKNQPKVINIADPRIEERDQHSERWYPFTSEYMFDFVPALSLNETVGVKKVLGSGGEFAPGVIQYAFTYYYKYGQESNIFYTTPLLYISYGDRGASPEDKVDNVFEITVKNLDTKFDYLRIYSIQRTSINATPFCKRVQDIALEGITDDKITFTDTGTIGDNVDPTELLYKGGETITAKALEQKDNTLFLGNLTIARESLNDYKNRIKEDLEREEDTSRGITQGIASAVRNLKLPFVVSSVYTYDFQLNATAKDDGVSPSGNNVPCGGFKVGETYRLGVQFQYESGKWSEPVFIKDAECKSGRPSVGGNDGMTLSLPCFKGSLSSTISTVLKNLGYKKIRPVVVFPTMQDRSIICQGVINPIIEHNNSVEESPSYQSSWFFRPQISSNEAQVKGIFCAPKWDGKLPYRSKDLSCDPIKTPIHNLRAVEIQGAFMQAGDTSPAEYFEVCKEISTLHSPDIEFDEQLKTMDYAGVWSNQVGKAEVHHTNYDISIQTETPTISNSGTGFIHIDGYHDGSWGIIGGPFYDDFIVDDLNSGDSNGRTFRAWDKERFPAKFMVYPWQATGSLNNDINRPANLGAASAVLKKKVISNLRYTDTTWLIDQSNYENVDAKIFYSNEVEILKKGQNFYNGNVDTIINPKYGDGPYFVAGDISLDWREIHFAVNERDITDNQWYKLFSVSEEESSNQGLYMWNNASDVKKWQYIGFGGGTDVGDYFVDLAIKKSQVRMKYKSSPHILLNTKPFYYTNSTSSKGGLPIIEIKKTVTERYGGTSNDALKANTWIPCGEPVKLNSEVDTIFYWAYGDTYYQRYDCLKTYAFTPEDPNQVVEIGSFMLETHVNIDGRYDRNRGQINNLNMSPQNFNLINPVYSQTDNFFSYRILDDDYYKNNEFPNQFTWTKEKQSGADVDLWTNITLASTYDIDGSKGAIKSLNFWKDTIYCFQDKGISRILFNSRVQIPASDGVPIEISNNYKVDGYQYLSDGIGCKNIHLIKETPSGIYFIDSVAGHLFQLGEGLSDITEKCNMTTWFKKEGPGITRVLYDDIHHDVYLPYDNGDWTLCFSEKVGQFTGFYSYGVYPMMESYNHRIFTLYPYSYETPRIGTLHSQELHTLFEGDYNTFFEYGNSKKIVYKPSEFTFICNGSSNNMVGADKIFTNLEFRASVEGDGELNGETGKFTPTLPLNTIEVWDEYQHGIATLENKSGHSFFEHFMDDGTASLKRKFRIWRCDIPRDNVPINPTTEAPMGIYRKGAVGTRPHRNDRMRNPWLFIKLIKDAPEEGNPRIELHDLQVTYFA